MKNEFDPIWQRIVECAGQTFWTVRGYGFTYQVDGRALTTSRTDRNLSRPNFEKAWGLLGSVRRSELRDAVQGSSYVVAILRDPRISVDASE